MRATRLKTTLVTSAASHLRHGMAQFLQVLLWPLLV